MYRKGELLGYGYQMRVQILFKRIIETFVIAICSYIFLLVVNCLAQAENAEEEAKIQSLKGYEIKFNYENYPIERQIAHQYFLDRYPEDSIKGKFVINKNDIGIDLYDIDGDGIQELIVYLMPSKNVTYYCIDKQGCPFAILKKTGEGSAKPYLELQWHRNQEDTEGGNMMLLAGIRILYSSSLGYRDILLLYPSHDPMELWQWNNKSYNLIKEF